MIDGSAELCFVPAPNNQCVSREDKQKLLFVIDCVWLWMKELDFFGVILHEAESREDTCDLLVLPGLQLWCFWTERPESLLDN